MPFIVSTWRAVHAGSRGLKIYARFERVAYDLHVESVVPLPAEHQELQGYYRIDDHWPLF